MALILIFGFSSIALSQNCPTNNTDIDGAYLINDCCVLYEDNSTYRLNSDITLDRAENCFHINWGQNKILDLGGHTITFDAQDLDEILNPSFELAGPSSDSAAHWDFTNAPSAQRVSNSRFWRFGEQHTLVFPSGSSASAGSPQYIESNDMVLPAGDYRAIYLFFANVSFNPQAFLQVTADGSVVSCSTETLRRPAPERHWWYHFCNFSLGSTATVNMRVGIDAVPSTDVIIDMAELRPRGSNIITSVSGTVGSEVGNGTIIQGLAKSFDITVVSLFPGGDASADTRVKVHDLDISVQGVGVLPISVRNINYGEVFNNIINIGATYFRDREAMLPVISINASQNPKVYNNEIYNAFQTGIITGGGSNGSEIYNNKVQLDVKQTNGYAIEAYGANNVIIHDNILTGNGRGIHLSGDTGAEVYGNTINMREYVNPEYNDPYIQSMQGLCAHGIRSEGMTNVHVYNNHVTMTADENTYTACPMNITGLSDGSISGVIENNTFISVANKLSESNFFTTSAISIGVVDADDDLTIRNNDLYCDESGLYISSGFDFTLDSNRMYYTGSGTMNDFHAIYVAGWPSLTMQNVTLLNNLVTDGTMDHPGIGWTGSNGWDYSVSWTLTVNVQDAASNPLENATVHIENDHGFSTTQTTPASGTLKFDLLQYEILGSSGFNYQKQPRDPYYITVTSNGDTLPQRNVYLSAPTTETFEFSDGWPDETAPAAVSDLEVVSCGTNSCNLMWSAPGDDIDTGRATQYDIRYNTTSINEDNWDSSEQIAMFITPDFAGTEQGIVVSGLATTTTYYFAMKSADEVPNWSLLSNVASGTTSDDPDGLAPFRYDGSPSGSLASGTASTTISLKTDERAECRYALSPGTPFSTMSAGFTNTESIDHSTAINGLVDGQSYSYFIRCQDAIGNYNTTDFTISFTVLSDSSGTDPGDTDITPQTFGDGEDENGYSVTGGCGSIGADNSHVSIISPLIFILIILLGFASYSNDRCDNGC